LRCLSCTARGRIFCKSHIKIAPRPFYCTFNSIFLARAVFCCWQHGINRCQPLHLPSIGCLYCLKKYILTDRTMVIPMRKATGSRRASMPTLSNSIGASVSAKTKPLMEHQIASVMLKLLESMLQSIESNGSNHESNESNREKGGELNLRWGALLQQN
jgi:hypothetical protein